MFLFFDEKISIGYMVAATNLSNFIISPCKVISQQYARIESTKRIRDKISRMINQEEGDDGQIITEIQSIAWENVSFRYTSHDESPGAKVLDEATMRWNKGDKILLMGKSGSGKTTIIRLLCKYFDDYEGSLKINSIELKQISRKSLCS